MGFHQLYHSMSYSLGLRNRGLSNGLSNALLFVPSLPFTFTDKLRMAKREAQKLAMNGRTEVDEMKRVMSFHALTHPFSTIISTTTLLVIV